MRRKFRRPTRPGSRTFTCRFGRRYGRPEARQRTSLPSSMRRLWLLWPIRRCARVSPSLVRDCRRANNRLPKHSVCCARTKPKSGGRLSGRRGSSRNSAAGGAWLLWIASLTESGEALARNQDGHDGEVEQIGSHAKSECWRVIAEVVVQGTAKP